MWAHDKDGVTRVFERCHQGVHSSRNPLVAPFKNSSDTIIVVFSHTFAFFWLRKTAVSVEIFQFCFHVCVRVTVHRDLFNFLVRVLIFLSLILCYLYFSTFLSTWYYNLQYITVTNFLKVNKFYHYHHEDEPLLAHPDLISAIHQFLHGFCYC